ncbi:hypothetical protein V3481_009584 [Fusarium oxysporum f. sp. vasinfectum]
MFNAASLGFALIRGPESKSCPTWCGNWCVVAALVRKDESHPGTDFNRWFFVSKVLVAWLVRGGSSPKIQGSRSLANNRKPAAH